MKSKTYKWAKEVYLTLEERGTENEYRLVCDAPDEGADLRPKPIAKYRLVEEGTVHSESVVKMRPVKTK